MYAYQYGELIFSSLADRAVGFYLPKATLNKAGKKVPPITATAMHKQDSSSLPVR